MQQKKIRFKIFPKKFKSTFAVRLNLVNFGTLSILEGKRESHEIDRCTLERERERERERGHESHKNEKRALKKATESATENVTGNRLKGSQIS